MGIFLKRGKGADLARVLGLFIIGFVFLRGSIPFALFTGWQDAVLLGNLMAAPFFMAGTSHLARRILFPGVDLRQLMRVAIQDKQTGDVVRGVCFVLGCLILASSQVKAAELPPGAVKYLPVLVQEQRAYWPEMSDVATLAGQTEQESCISLKHSKCWTPYAELKTDRERGVGFGQITQTPRFDSLAEMKTYAPEALKGWGWNSPTLYDPSYQFRALVLMNKRNYTNILGVKDPAERLAMMLVAYNGGQGRVVNDRRMCEGTPGCNSSRWFGHVEHTSSLPKVSTHKGYRSFFAINREYPRKILFERRGRYVEAVAHL